MKMYEYIGDCHDEQVQWGGNDDPRKFLAEGHVYEVLEVDVHSWHTRLILVDFPDKRFNAVNFREYEEDR